MEDEDELVRVQVMELLEEIGEAAVDPLIEALSHPNKLVRRGAAKILGNIKDPRAIEPLIKALSDDNKWVRREASTALSKMGEKAFKPLLKALKDDDWKVRGAAAWAIGNLKDERAVDP